MGVVKEITGQKFGRLTVLEMLDERINNYVACKCRCDCGNIIIVQSGHLRSGHTQSCGCYKSDRIKETHCTKASQFPRLYGIWGKMKERCTNKNCKGYKDYGSRGIKVCNDWFNDFENFCLWALDNGYKDTLTIERINVNGNYEPQNCTWIPSEEQSKNRRINIYIDDYDGSKLILEDFSQKYHLNRSTIKYRYSNGDRGQRLVRPTKSNKENYKNYW